MQNILFRRPFLLVPHGKTVSTERRTRIAALRSEKMRRTACCAGRLQRRPLELGAYIAEGFKVTIQINAACVPASGQQYVRVVAGFALRQRSGPFHRGLQGDGGAARPIVPANPPVFTLRASHELEKPLSTMSLHQDTAHRETESSPPKQRQWMLTQLEGVQRLTRIVDGVTLRTKVDAGLVKIERQATAAARAANIGLHPLNAWPLAVQQRGD